MDQTFTFTPGGVPQRAPFLPQPIPTDLPPVGGGIDWTRIASGIGSTLSSVGRSIYQARSATLEARSAKRAGEMEVGRIYSETARTIGTAKARAGAQGRKISGSVEAVTQDIGQAGESDAIAAAYRAKLAETYGLSQARLYYAQAGQQAFAGLLGTVGSEILRQRQKRTYA